MKREPVLALTLALVLLSAFASCSTADAGARPSAPLAVDEAGCPTEATVLSSASLLDAQGQELGGIASGTVVRVRGALESSAAEGGQLEIELQKPVRTSARIASLELQVFASEQLEVIPGFLFIPKGTPMVVLERKQGAFTVAPFETHRSRAEYQTLAFSVPCRQLRGRSLLPLEHDGCHGASVRWRDSPERRQVVLFRRERLQRDGQPGALGSALPVERVRGLLVDDAGHSFRPHHSGVLLERGKTRSRLEVHEDGRLFRGWMANDDFEELEPGYGSGVGHLCCEGVLSGPGELTRGLGMRDSGARPAELRLLKLRRPTALSATPGGSAFVTLPAGAAVVEIREEGKPPGLLRYEWGTEESSHGMVWGFLPQPLPQSPSQSPSQPDGGVSR